MGLITQWSERWRRNRQLPEPTALYGQMDEWLRSPLGAALLAAEREMLAPVLERVFGYHILQMGCSDTSVLQDSPVGHKMLFVPSYKPGCTVPVADNEALPLGTESIDAVVIHHALDFTPDSHRLLREAARVLMPGGKLLIVGFNPLSSWGVRKMFRWKNQSPWNGRFITSLRISDWLRLLDFKIDKVSHGAYMLPINSVRMLNGAMRFKSFSRQIPLPTGAVYLIVACKQVMPVTPVMPRWPRIPRPVIVRPVGEAAGIRRTIRKSDNKPPRSLQ